MDEEKRSNGGYEIIESCTIGSNELVIGHNPNAPNPYVCWYCKGGDNYFWGYYCNDISAAREKLNERYQTECRISDTLQIGLPLVKYRLRKAKIQLEEVLRKEEYDEFGRKNENV